MIYLGQDPIGISNIPESYPELVQNVAALNEEIISKAPVVYREASGDIITISDGADGMPLKDCTVQIDPVQDLHGYDNPWPAGGGIQLIPYPGYDSMPVTKNGVTITDIGNGRIHIQGTATGMVYFNFYGNASTPIPAWVKPDTQYTLRPATVASKYFVQFILYGSPTYAATGSTFTTPSDLSGYTGFAIVIGVYNGAEVNADISPMLEYGATAHDFVPYSNICPITGHTGTNVYRTGKNLINKASGKISSRFMVLGVDNFYDTVQNGSIKLEAGTYTLSLSGENSTIADSLAVYNSVNTRIAVAYNVKKLTFTVATPGTFRVTLAIKTEDFVSWDNYNVQLEKGSTDTEYEPFGSTYPISWQTAAGTVYGGYVDPVTGELTVTFGYDDLGNLTWDKDTAETTDYGNYSFFYATPSVSKARNANFICSQYATVDNSRYRLFNNQIGIFNTNASGYLRFAIRDDRYTDYTTDQFKAAMSGMYVAYELLEPYTVQLNPVTITTLLVENNLWADTGALSLTYPADTKTYVDDHTPVQDVQIGGTSIVLNGIASIPHATDHSPGVFAVGAGLKVLNDFFVVVDRAGGTVIKAGTESTKILTAQNTHNITFYGLAKAAGDTTQASSSNAVGTYTPEAKSAISVMLNGAISVSGTTPTITGQSGLRYVCGTVDSISITPPNTGIIDVVFTSGTTPAVMTVPNTVRFPAWFNPASLDASMKYEINIMDGTDGAVMVWSI